MGQRKDASAGAKATFSLQESLTVAFNGLYTYPNQFGDGPSNALNAVQNCVLDSPGVIDCRRGRKVYQLNKFTTAVQALTFDTINSRTIVHCSNDTIYVDNGSGTFTAVSGAYKVPDVTDVESRVRTLNVNSNLYLTTGNGVYKMQSASSTPIPAGAPVGLGGYGTTTGASGFLANSVNVAYRIVWLYIDANNNLVQGAPSGRIIVSNSSGATANVSLTFVAPTTVDTTWTYQIYRSNQSASLVTDPDDQMQQVYQDSPTAAQITSRTITITDSTPDTLRQQTLYTTTQGIQNANYQPPYSKSLALFKGSMFYGNTSLRQTYFSTLISGSLLVNGDTIKFYRGATLLFTLTGAAAENTATGTFLVATGGTPSQNITNTANSIVRVVNLYASNASIDADYSSAYASTPGQMTFTDRLFNTLPFNVVCSRTGTVFSPTLPASGITNTNTSNSNSNPHYLYFSKYLQPEAVPLTNTLTVGSSAYPIVRIIPLRDSLIVIKSDGVYKVTGTSTANFSVVPIDVQLKISSINSAVALNNQVYAVTSQGLVTIQDNGAVQILSIPIQRDILSLASSNYPGYKGASWGFAYPDDQKYYFYTITNASDTTSTQCYVYNYITKNWTIDTQAFTAGFINPVDGKFYGSKYSATGTVVYVERKTLSDFDFADEEYPITITSSSGTNITLVSTTALAVGMTLGQGVSFSNITAINGNTVTVADLIFWTAGAALAYQPIFMSFTTNPLDNGDPTMQKQFSEASVITVASALAAVRVSFVNDLGQIGIVTPTVAPPAGTAYGTGAYGTGIYGGSVPQSYLRTRMLIPANTQKGNWISLTFTVAQAFKRVRFSALQLIVRKIGIRQR